MQTEDDLGRKLGDYLLFGLLGTGTTGSTYLGERLQDHTQVAVKVLKARLVDQKEIAQFVNAVGDQATRLRQKHIMALRDFGIANDVPFLVMDYAPNGTLRQHHSLGTRLPLGTVVSHVKQIASALQYAHDQGLVHGNVKPENLLIGSNEQLLVSDFGIAVLAALQGEQHTTGTPTYMAPEQFRYGEVGPASDQYALGILTYEWLCGKPPFSAANFWQLAYQHREVPPPSLRERMPDLSTAVEQIVLRALAKDQYSRFASIQLFAEALEQGEKELVRQEQEEQARQAEEQGDAYYAAARYATNRYYDGLAAYERALRLAPETVRLYMHKGDTLIHLQRYDEALAAYEQALRLEPKNAQFYAYKGEALLLKGEELASFGHYHEAIEVYKQVLRLESTSEVRLQKQQAQKAIRKLRLEELIGVIGHRVSSTARFSLLILALVVGFGSIAFTLIDLVMLEGPWIIIVPGIVGGFFTIVYAPIAIDYLRKQYLAFREVWRSDKVGEKAQAKTEES